MAPEVAALFGLNVRRPTEFPTALSIDSNRRSLGRLAEIRAEAVHQALAEYAQGKKERPNVLQPVKRRQEPRSRIAPQWTVSGEPLEIGQVLLLLFTHDV